MQKFEKNKFDNILQYKKKDKDYEIKQFMLIHFNFFK
jgi:hypothetical protein